MTTLIAQALKLYQAFFKERARREELEQELKERYAFQNIIYASPEMKEIVKTALKVAPTKVTVLIRKESGTGKELLARAIHFFPPRAEKPFIAINCVAIPETLFKAVLFGYEKGAFTGAFTSKKENLNLLTEECSFLMGLESYLFLCRERS